jgi:hypothetical protein
MSWVVPADTGFLCAKTAMVMGNDRRNNTILLSSSKNGICPVIPSQNKVRKFSHSKEQKKPV